jgi:hypothetical protein
MCRKFRAILSGERPEIIIADTKIDAECQANEMAKHLKTSVIHLCEVLPIHEINTRMQIPSFEQQFNNIFGG